MTTVRKLKLKADSGCISRSREFLDYRPGAPAWALIDIDLKGMLGSVAAKVEACGGAWGALLNLAPGLAKAERVSRASTSSGLFRSDSGEPLSGSGGAHHFVLVKDGADIARFLLDLHDRCWLNGWGWHLIGGAGQLLERSLVDRMVGLASAWSSKARRLSCHRWRRSKPSAFLMRSKAKQLIRELVVPPLTEFEGSLVRRRLKPRAQRHSTRPRPKFGRDTTGSWRGGYQTEPACRSLRRCAWSRRGTGACSCPIWSWTSTIWAL